jgi:hypothetical protein
MIFPLYGKALMKMRIEGDELIENDENHGLDGWNLHPFMVDF